MPKANARPAPTRQPRREAEPARRQPIQSRSKATVARLLDALGLHLTRFGFRALNTNAIAAEAGVSVGTIYNYFPDVVAMLEAYAARSLSGWLELWASEPAFEPRSDWRNSLRRSFRKTVERARTDYAYVLIVNAYGTIPEFEDTILRIRERQIQASTVIHQRISHELSPRQAEIMATVMLDVGWAAVMHIARDEENHDLELEYEKLLIAYMAQYLDAPGG